MSENVESKLVRANRVTTYWTGEGVATAIFYKTHDKVLEVKSSDPQVMTLGFTMPEGTEESPITAAQKLEAYKNFIIGNAGHLGIMYDPVDRRADAFKFPNKYDEASAKEYGQKMVANTIEKLLTQLKANVVDKLVKAELLPENTMPQYSIGDATVTVTENYSSGAIKYGTIAFPLTLGITGGESTVETTVNVELVSGQLKKPRNIGDTVMTMTGIKDMLTTAGVLPKKPEKVKETPENTDTAEAPKED